MRPAEKRVNEMNRLKDMLHFPVVVNAGATLNVLLTVALTWYIEPRQPALAGLWIALVLGLNLLPVVLLRLSLKATTAYPALQEMDFFRDQHKFSDWVYLAASANMTFWILLTWTASALHRTTAVLVVIEGVAFVATFSPVILRQRWMASPEA
jgi:hypothetical protein